MKRIKLLFIFVAILLLSGCSGVYDLKINEDQSIVESIDLNIEKQEDTYDKINKLFKEYDILDDDYTISETNDGIKVIYSREYMNYEDYIVNSVLYKELFNDLNYTNENGIVSFNANTKILANTPLGSTKNVVNAFDIPILNINIEVANEVVSNNADSITGNIYTWSIDKDTKDKTISLKISSDNNSNNRLYIIVLIAVGAIVLGSIIIIIVRFVKRQKL